jgi:hypothetical protein
MEILPPYDKIGVTPTPPFVNANPSSGITGSIVNAEVFNALQEEIVNAQAGAGLAQNPDDYTQLNQSIRSQLSAYYVDTGAANSPTIAPANPAVTQLVDGMFFRVKMAAAPTGASVLHVNSLSAPIVRRAGTPLVGGEWTASDIVGFTYSSALGAFQVAGLCFSDLFSNSGFRAFTTAGTWTFTVPANVYWLESIEGVGAGGGGAGASGASYPASAGSGGGYSLKRRIRVNPGDTFTVVIGAPGTGGVVGANGTAGGTTSVTTASGSSGIAMTMNGGQGGTTAYGGSQDGGTSSGGDINIPGGMNLPTAILQSNGQRVGASGGSSKLGFGGPGGAASPIGAKAGNGYGSGGGGGGYDGTNQAPGANGAVGAVFFYY